MLRVFLMVEDSGLRRMLRSTIPWEQWGYTVAGLAGNGEAALPLLRRYHSDVLITDTELPIMDSFPPGQPLPKIIRISDKGALAPANGEWQLQKPVGQSELRVLLEDIRKESVGAPIWYDPEARQEPLQRLISGGLPRVEPVLSGGAYTLVLTTDPGEPQLLDALMAHFLKYPQYQPFRWDPMTLAVLVSGTPADIPTTLERCIRHIRQAWSNAHREQAWYAAVATPVPAPERLPDCAGEVQRLWAYRYIFPERHLLTADTLRRTSGGDLSRLELSLLEPGRITEFLESGKPEEIPGFVEEYLRALAEALDSAAFCQYLMLSLGFTAMGFLEGKGIPRQAVLATLPGWELDGGQLGFFGLRRYTCDLLRCAMELRAGTQGKAYRGLLREAMDYIDHHFREPELSLTQVAEAARVSPNHLSAVFRRETGGTFTEYLTKKRMEAACTLLTTSNMPTARIAAGVGYRDARYFGVLFKKRHGQTPREYRRGQQAQHQAHRHGQS